MKKLFSLLSAVTLYFCLATVLALVVAIGAMWFKGALDEERMYRVLAALHGIDLLTMQRHIVAQEKAADSEQPSHAARLRQQMLTSLDLDLREQAIGQGLQSMKEIQSHLERETSRFDDLRQAYAVKLQELADEEQATALKELQRTLEAIKPEQAKEQILKMLDDDSMDAVVTIMKNMPIDKRKKIIAEFKQGADADQLYEILRNIRLGEPMVSQIEDAQEKLKQFGPTQ